VFVGLRVAVGGAWVAVGGAGVAVGGGEVNVGEVREVGLDGIVGDKAAGVTSAVPGKGSVLLA
jgi:hypothetical protein